MPTTTMAIAALFLPSLGTHLRVIQSPHGLALFPRSLPCGDVTTINNPFSLVIMRGISPGKLAQTPSERLGNIPGAKVAEVRFQVVALDPSGDWFDYVISRGNGLVILWPVCLDLLSRHETSGELSHHFGSKVIELKCSALGKRWLFQPLFID
jgi:hypothetical protein